MSITPISGQKAIFRGGLKLLDSVFDSLSGIMVKGIILNFRAHGEKNLGHLEKLPFRQITVSLRK